MVKIAVEEIFFSQTKLSENVYFICKLYGNTIIFLYEFETYLFKTHYSKPWQKPSTLSLNTTVIENPGKVCRSEQEYYIHENIMRPLKIYVTIWIISRFICQSDTGLVFSLPEQHSGRAIVLSPASALALALALALAAVAAANVIVLR